MLQSKWVVAGVLAGAASACAFFGGIGDYRECTTDCDGAVGPREGGVTDGARPPGDGGPASVPDDGSDAGPLADDGGSGPSDATEGLASDAADAGNGRDAGPTCPAPTDIDGGLLVYYPLEGDTNDHSGNGNNGAATVGTDIAFGAGKVGQGITIRPAGRGIAVSGTTTLGAARTLCAWVDATSGTTGGGLPIFVAGPTGLADLYDLSAANPADNCAAQVANTLFIDHWGGPCTRSNRNVAPGAWSLVCFAQSATSTAFFVDGAVSNFSTSNYMPALSAITVGSDRIGGSTTQVVFRGQLDEISIWSGTLSTADMNAIYNGGNGCALR